jgi:hypothetical protein
MPEKKTNDTCLQNSILEIAVEAWRFRRVFASAVSKLDVEDSNRYLNQYLYFFKKVESALGNANFKIVNVEGEKYDVGMAVIPLNMEEFSEDDNIVIEQMIEPLIMNSGKVAKPGTVILRRQK